MSEWSLGDKLAFAGLIVAVIGVIVGLMVPEVRCFLHLENCPPKPSITATVPTTSIESIPPEKAGDYIGRIKRVCGSVAKAYFDQKGKGSPTFLNLDKGYPDEIFSIVIWSEDRAKFGPKPEQDYLLKDICVTGTIEKGPRVAQIVARSVEQIEPWKR